jgi:predicted nucleotidyltransferase
MPAPDLPFTPSLVRSLVENWRESLVGLAAFGSVVRGEAGPGSDVDLLIVLEPGSRIDRTLYHRWDTLLAGLRTPSGGRVEPQFVALPPSPDAAGSLWLEVAREGRVLFERQGRLTRLLIALRDRMMSEAVVRRTTHGHPYWVHERNPA